MRHAAWSMRVLLVEDHAELADTVATGLRREGMAVDVALDGTDALAHLALTDYDVLVLDRDLPGVHGDEICRTLVAERREGRILMLTAAGTIEDRVDGLSLGVDDYLPKPFAFAELAAGVGPPPRRSGATSPPALVHGDLRVDPANRLASRDGQRLALSPKEFAVLEYLLGADGRIVSAEELLTRVWDENAARFTTTVKVTIRRLRAKLGEPPLIETVTRGAYRIGGRGERARQAPGTGRRSLLAPAPTLHHPPAPQPSLRRRLSRLGHGV